ncbi:chaperone NapD [Thalassotalea sp. LPB0316]|uniref:chaperone NapD n=1 Tax=Thalassotalea sp. LPB0316 TaxID=2769490 RepID=UPI00186966B8|nr:chaperone NapD [Thalassotalea sp. LPB0316]QOL26964.1 chaperone NapD [Thalassotalea sp. LPB0316]
MNNVEYHVASFVAHVMPEDIDELSELINLQQGGQVHAVSEDGKIVFTIEASSHKAVDHLIAPIQIHKKVMSLSPVYHQYLNEQQAS